MKTTRQKIDEAFDAQLAKITKANGYNINVAEVRDSWSEFADINLPGDSVIAFHFFGLENIPNPDYENNFDVESNLDMVLGVHFSALPNQSYSKTAESIILDLLKFLGYVIDENIDNDNKLDLLQIPGVQTYWIRQISPVFYDDVKNRGEVFLLITIIYLLK